jgi:sn-glycerol 3-phosphate transport system permease protein
LTAVDTQSLGSAGAATAPTKAQARAKAAKPATQKRAIFKNNWLGFAFAVPQLLLVFTFFYWPASQAVYWAFTSQSPFGGSNDWVGFSNFESILTDSVYWDSIIRSFIFAGLSTGISMGIGLVMALLVDRELAGNKIYRSVLVWPYAIAAPALGLAFRFMLAPQAGVLAFVNHIWPGIWDPSLNGNQAMGAIIFAFSWKYVGYNFIFLLAALQAIPRSLIEAAAIDGAGPVRRFFGIALPLLSPTSFFLLTVNVVYAFFDTFPVIDAATGGGPAQSTKTLIYKIFAEGFQGLDIGSSGAQSVVLMVIVVALTIVQFRFIERRVQYS